MISRGRGSIASTSSVSALTGGGFLAGRITLRQKPACWVWIKDMARELGPKGIRVNAVAPGMVDTEIRGDLMSQEIFDKILSSIPMGRIASPTEIGNIFLFLASDLSSFVTGATIDVNGGMYIR